MDKRYQVFVSSTFRDLVEERAAVTAAILSLQYFPAGMELFAADDRTPWEVIKRVIDDSDYYILVIAGRYGSVDAEGVSFTEREYDYAVENGKPVLAFVHGEPEKLPFERCEESAEMRERLAEFRAKVMRKLVKSWRTADELGSAVLASLALAVQQLPAVGWVRANRVANEEALQRIVRLQDELEEARNTVEAMRAMFNPTREINPQDVVASLSEDEATLLLLLANADHSGFTTLEQFTLDATPESRSTYERILSFEEKGWLDQSGPELTLRFSMNGWKIVDELRKFQLLQTVNDNALPGDNYHLIRDYLKIPEKDFLTLVNSLERDRLLQRQNEGNSLCLRCYPEGSIVAERVPLRLIPRSQ